MPIAFPCENCGRRYEVADSLAGKKGRCKACGHLMLIPGAVSAPGRPDRGAEVSAAQAGAPSSRSTAASAPAGAGGARRWWIAAAVAAASGLIVLMLLGTTGRIVAAGLAILIGLALTAAGGVGGLIAAFRESVQCGLLYLLVPFYALYYLVTRWSRMKRYFLWAVSGAGVLLVTSVAAPLLLLSGGVPPPADPAIVSREVLVLPPVAHPETIEAERPASSPEPDAVGEIRQFEGHTGEVSAVAFLPDGRRGISGGDTSIRLWDLESGKQLRRYEGHTGAVKSIVVTRDGQRILSGSSDRTLRLWDTETGQEKKRLEGHAADINRLAIAPDGRRAASTSWDKTLRLWDLESGQELHRVDFDGPTTGVAYSPDGQTLLVTSGDHSVRLLDAGDAHELHRLEGYDDWVGEAAFAPDGRIFATGEGLPRGRLRLWDVEGPKALRASFPGPDSGWSIRFTPDSQRVLVVAFDQIVLVEVASGRELHRFRGHSGQVDCVRVSPDGRSFLSSGHDRTVRLWGLPAPAPAPAALANAPAPAPETPATAPEPVPAPAAAPEPRPAAPAAELLARAAEARRKLDSDGENADTLLPAFSAALRAAAPALTEIAAGTPEHPTSTFTRVVLNNRRLGFDGIRFKAPADGPRFDLQWEFIMPAVDNKRGREMKAWYILPLSGEMIGFSSYGLGDDEPEAGVDIPEKYHVVQWLGNAQIKPGNEYLLWFSFEPQSPPVPTYVKINLIPPQADVQQRLRLTAAALKQTFKLADPACGLGVTPDGHRAWIAAGSNLYRGDVATGQVEKVWEGPTGDVRTVAFSPGGTLAAVGCGDSKIRLVDLAAGKLLRTCEGHSSALRCLAFLPDGKRFVSGAEDQSARLWLVASGKELRRFDGHTDQVLCLAVSPDGRRLATGPSINDKVGRLWDLETGKLVGTLEGNSAAIYALGFSPDGRRIATAGEDRSMRLFDAAKGQPICKFPSELRATPHALAFLPDGRRVVLADDSGFLTFWSTTAGRYLGAYESALEGTHLFAPIVGDRLLAGGGDRNLRLLTLPSTDEFPDVQPPTPADLAYFQKVVDDLEASTPEELDKLTELTLNARADDAGLAHLARLTNLKALAITGATKLRGAGLAQLMALKQLRTLDLSRSAVGDAGLAHLAPLTGLEHLSLAGTKVTNAGIPQLRPLSSLKSLDLQSTAVGLAAMETLVDLPQLETLNLDRTRVDDFALSLIRGFKSLRTLHLHNTRASKPAIARLRQAMPRLEIVD